MASSREYLERLRKRTRADLRDYCRRKGLGTAAGVGGACFLVSFIAGGAATGKWLSTTNVVVSLIGIFGGIAIWYVGAWAYYRLRAPFELDKVRAAQLSDVTTELAHERFTANAKHSRELVTITARHTHELAAAGDRHAVLEQQYNELRAARPRLATGLLYEFQGQLIVPITNHGATATVWAKLSVTGNTLTKRFNVHATWKSTTAQEVTIGAGETIEIVIAEPGHGEDTGAGLFLFYYWVPFIENGEHKRTRAMAASWPNDPNPNARQHVAVKVFSNPSSICEPIDVSLTLVGCDRWENVVGVVSGPFPAAVPFESESNPRAAFNLAAGLLVVRFGEIRDATEPPTAEEWDSFKRQAAKASMLADNLPEAQEVRSLVRPFLEVEQSNLENCFAAAVNLQTFILQHPPQDTISES